MINRRKHPVSAKDVCRGFCVDIIYIGSRDPDVAIEEVVGLEFSHKFVFEKSMSNINIPEHYERVGGEHTGFFLPGISGTGIEVEVPEEI